MSDGLPLLRLQAQAGFEAARREHSGMSGHSFVVQVRAAARSPAALQRALDERVAGLDATDLQDRLAATDDAALAAWIAEGLRAHGVEQVLLHAGARRGARWEAGRLTHWRRYGFEAAHQLPEVAPGHKCGRMHGHGFAVLLHAEAAAPAIDAAWAPLQFMLNRQCLNRIAGLDNPTSEVIAAWIWQRLSDSLDGLDRVTVFETGSSGAAFDGRRHGIWKQFTLDSAVMDGAELLGHTYALRLHLSGALHPRFAWVHDFGDVKQAFAPIFEQLDHQPLHERLGDAARDVQALAQWIFARSVEAMPALHRIDLDATPGCGAIVARDAAALHAGP